MGVVSSWLVGQTDALIDCINTVTLAYNDGLIAFIGALTGRIYFFWLKPFLKMLVFPITYAGGIRLGFNYEFLNVFYNI